MGRRIKALRAWKAKTYISTTPILGGISGRGDLMAASPGFAAISLFNRNPAQGQTMGLDATVEEEIEKVGKPDTPDDLESGRTMYVYSDKGFDLIIRNYEDGRVEDWLPSEALSLLAQYFEAILEDPYGEVQGSWASLHK